VQTFRLVRNAASAAALLFGLTACINGAQASDAPNVNTDATISPLSEFLGASPWNNAEEVRLLTSEMTINRENLIAQCMRENGFTYTPDVNSGRFAIGGAVFDETQPNDPNWVAQYGFGIVSGHWQASSNSNERIGIDPNLEYLDSLTASERYAFNLALNGSPQFLPHEDMTQSDLNELWANRGCWGRAHLQAMAESPLFVRDNNEFAPLFEALSELGGMVANSPEMYTLHRDWAHCMANQGQQSFNNPSDPIFQIVLEHHDLVNSRDASSYGAVQNIRNREIELALTDLSCRVAIDYQNRVKTLVFAAENQFIADHRQTLEAYRAAQEQRS